MVQIFPKNLFNWAPLVLLLLLTGCLFDPTPEPDGIEAERDFDGDSGSGTGITDSPPEISVYVSGPGSDGWLTVVGLSGAMPGSEETVAILATTDSMDEEISIQVQGDGSFAFRIHSGDIQGLRVYSQGGDDKEDSDEIYNFGFDPVPWTPNRGHIFGDGTVSSRETDRVTITGNGALLRMNAIVIAGNITGSTSSSATVTCDPQCHFELNLSAQSGDEIDLFIVAPNAEDELDEEPPQSPDSYRFGDTDAQRVVVP